MSKFKVGDRVVTDTGNGEGEIVDIEGYDIEYPIIVNLDNGEVLGFEEYELEAVE